MMAHKLIDALRGRSPSLHVAGHVDREEMASSIETAEKFDFGPLALEADVVHQELGQTFKVPALTDEEDAFMDEGLVPLPADLCWYEYKVDGPRQGMLVCKLGQPEEVFTMTIIEFDRHTGVGGVSGIWLASLTGGRVSVGGCPPEKAQRVTDALEGRLGEDHAQVSRATFLGHMGLVKYFTLMINSRSTQRVAAAGRERRPGSSRSPLPAHTVVTIIPKTAFLRGSGTHASPRLHWRRSHLRRYESGRMAVIPRCLVGKAELGCVTHEYRVPQEEKP